MRRTMKWSAPLAALLAMGVAAPANAQAQDFQTNVEKARTTLANIATLLDKVAARQKAGATVSATPVANRGGGKTYTLILTGAQ